MKEMTLYVKKDTCLTRLHPFVKAMYVLTAIGAPLIGGARWFFLFAILCSLLLLVLGGVCKKVMPLVGFSLPLLLTIFLIHGMFHKSNATLLWQWGPLAFYQEGVLYALKIALNILNMLFAFGLFVLTTNPVRLVNAMEQKGFSPRMGYMLLSVFQILPHMMGEVQTIWDAQRSRGVRTEGNLLHRAKAFLPLMGPLVSGTLINTRERAIALEVRGFTSNKEKTYLSLEKFRKTDQICMAVLWLLLLTVLAWRVYHGIH